MILETIFEEFKIDNKIFAIGFDNASNNNNNVITHLINLCNLYFGGIFFYQKCDCHVLNLCVQNGLTLLQESIRRLELHFIICENIHK